MTKTAVLVNGKPIRFRREQQVMWLVNSILLGTGFIAGVYWLILQQRYHFGALNISLKHWWDSGMGFIHSGNWGGGVYPERHAIRNLGEPAMWTMVGMIILGKAEVNQRLLSVKWLVIAPVLLLAVLLAGATGISLILAHVPAKYEKFSLLSLALGMALGRLLHFGWSPVGGTIRHRIVARSVERGGIPLWVRLPLLPPAWRELWSELGGKAAGFTSGGKKASTGRRHHHIGLVLAMLLIFVVIAVIGDVAKWGAPHGYLLPGMTT